MKLTGCSRQRRGREVPSPINWRPRSFPVSGGQSSTMVMPSKAKRPKRLATRSCLGPVADLEAHLPEEWWRKLFNALYVKTDGDVVENTREHAPRGRLHRHRPPRSSRTATSSICAAARAGTAWSWPGAASSMSWALDRSRYLVRLAKKRAQGEGLQVLFKEGDARNPRLAENSMRLRCHHGQLVRLLLQQAGRREGPDRGRQDPAPQRPARARHHRRRPHARALRQALVGVDRRAPLRLPRALASARTANG